MQTNIKLIIVLKQVIRTLLELIFLVDSVKGSLLMFGFWNKHFPGSKVVA